VLRDRETYGWMRCSPTRQRLDPPPARPSLRHPGVSDDAHPRPTVTAGEGSPGQRLRYAERAADDWRSFSSTQVPVRLWLGSVGEGWLVAFSQPAVASELVALTGETATPLPPRTAAARQVADLTQIYWVVRRAYQLSGTLPDELFHEFERMTKDLPQTTEVERLVVQGVGQDLFREGLLR
jgi:hypothetical protein